MMVPAEVILHLEPLLYVEKLRFDSWYADLIAFSEFSARSRKNKEENENKMPTQSQRNTHTVQWTGQEILWGKGIVLRSYLVALLKFLDNDSSLLGTWVSS